MTMPDARRAEPHPIARFNVFAMDADKVVIYMTFHAMGVYGAVRGAVAALNDSYGEKIAWEISGTNGVRLSLGMQIDMAEMVLSALNLRPQASVEAVYRCGDNEFFPQPYAALQALRRRDFA